jgi:hypothetical protein
MARIKMGLYGDSFVEVWSEEKKKTKRRRTLFFRNLAKYCSEKV